MIYKTTLFFKTEEERNNFKKNIGKHKEELARKPVEARKPEVEEL